MNIILSVHWILAASIWYVVMGLLHDIYVLKNHKGPYSRDLLRLLMDGHVLILSGALLGVCYMMMLNKIQCGCIISLIVGIGMLVYCSLIFPFLKSYVTMFISVMVVVVAIYLSSTFPDIWGIMAPYRK